MTALSKPTILFFDSGVGGFSVYQEVQKLLPDCHYLYCFDNAFFPYSEKSEEMIIERVNKICAQINQDYALDLIVIACNTASTVVLPSLRQRFSTIPIVGTVPAVKPAAEYSQTKHIGLLATKGTVKRNYINELIDKYAQDCRVERIGSTKLVELAERKLHGYPIDLSELKNELADWIDMADLDTVILGCTHFPFLKEEIKLCLPQVKNFVDSGEAIAQRVKALLNDIKVRSKNSTKNWVFCTKSLALKDGLPQLIHSLGFEELNLLVMDD